MLLAPCQVVFLYLAVTFPPKIPLEWWVFLCSSARFSIDLGRCFFFPWFYSFCHQFFQPYGSFPEMGVPYINYTRSFPWNKPSSDKGDPSMVVSSRNLPESSGALAGNFPVFFHQLSRESSKSFPADLSMFSSQNGKTHILCPWLGKTQISLWWTNRLPWKITIENR